MCNSLGEFMSQARALCRVIACYTVYMSACATTECPERVKRQLEDFRYAVVPKDRFFKRRFGLTYRQAVLRYGHNMDAVTLDRVQHHEWCAALVASLRGCEQAALLHDLLTVSVSEEDERPPLEPPLSRSPRFKPNAPNA